MRFLLPHERWLVRRLLCLQQTHQTTAVVRMEQEFGPRNDVDGYVPGEPAVRRRPGVREPRADHGGGRA